MILTGGGGDRSTRRKPYSSVTFSTTYHMGADPASNLDLIVRSRRIAAWAMVGTKWIYWKIQLEPPVNKLLLGNKNQSVNVALGNNSCFFSEPFKTQIYTCTLWAECTIFLMLTPMAHKVSTRLGGIKFNLCIGTVPVAARSKAARLLRLRFESHRGHGRLSVECCVVR